MLLSLVIPVFNEQDVIPLLLSRLSTLLPTLDCDYEIIFVNDGSTDDTLDRLRSAALLNPRIRVLSFGRNFGHQLAVTAGLDFAEGDAVVVMDADLQDPPELLAKMIALYRSGYDIVSPQRIKRESETAMKRLTARLFYKVMKKAVDARLQEQVGDFRLFSKRVVHTLRSMREHHRFLRGMVASLGYREALLPFERKSRAAGETKYPLSKMMKFAWTAISSFSGLPLRAAVAMGFLVSLAGVVYLFYTLYVAFVTHTVVQGWASLVVLQCLFSGTLLVTIGLVGDYIARIYEEVKRRPLYVLDQVFNIKPDVIEEQFFATAVSSRRDPS